MRGEEGGKTAEGVYGMRGKKEKEKKAQQHRKTVQNIEVNIKSNQFDQSITGLIEFNMGKIVLKLVTA